jgi:hypothetical protein
LARRRPCSAADAGAAGHADAARHRGVRADVHVVADLDQVVELDAVVDHGVVERAAVDAGVGADLDVVADAHRAELLDLLPAPSSGAKPKPSAPITTPAVHDAARAPARLARIASRCRSPVTKPMCASPADARLARPARGRSGGPINSPPSCSTISASRTSMLRLFLRVQRVDHLLGDVDPRLLA